MVWVWDGVLSDRNEYNVTRDNTVYSNSTCLCNLPHPISSYLLSSYLTSDVGSERHSGRLLAPTRRPARYVRLHARTYTCTAYHAACKAVWSHDHSLAHMTQQKNSIIRNLFIRKFMIPKVLPFCHLPLTPSPFSAYPSNPFNIIPTHLTIAPIHSLVHPYI
jgi:hypothetical protein